MPSRSHTEVPRRPELDARNVEERTRGYVQRWLANPEFRAAIRRGVTEEDLRAQRRSWVAGEAAMGNDADEAAYRVAYERGDKEEMARLDAEGEKRRQRALKRMREMGDEAAC